MKNVSEYNQHHVFVSYSFPNSHPFSFPRHPPSRPPSQNCVLQLKLTFGWSATNDEDRRAPMGSSFRLAPSRSYYQLTRTDAVNPSFLSTLA